MLAIAVIACSISAARQSRGWFRASDEKCQDAPWVVGNAFTRFQLLVYCNGKRDDDWPRNHQSTLPVDRFQADEALPYIQQSCRHTVCGWRRADLRPDYSVQQMALYGGGWIIRPAKMKRTV